MQLNRTIGVRQVTWYDFVQFSGAPAKKRAVVIQKEQQMALAAKLKELRVKHKKSLQDVADEVGASKAHIWDLETGKSKNPSLELLVELAKCFKVSVADLVGENPASKGEDPQIRAMYRELKELTERDREAIRMMMDHLKSRKNDEG